jgi:hypothetical protein
LCILPEHQKLYFKKDIFERLEWLKTCFDAFLHTSRPPENVLKKDTFDRLGWLKKGLMHFCIFPDHQKNVLKKDIFDRLEWLKTRNFFFKKDVFNCLEWLKTCFDVFANTSKPPKTFFQKIYF